MLHSEKCPGNIVLAFFPHGPPFDLHSNFSHLFVLLNETILSNSSVFTEYPPGQSLHGKWPSSHPTCRARGVSAVLQQHDPISKLCGGGNDGEGGG
jgi:hypothetical protein